MELFRKGIILISSFFLLIESSLASNYVEICDIDEQKMAQRHKKGDILVDFSYQGDNKYCAIFESKTPAPLTLEEMDLTSILRQSIHTLIAEDAEKPTYKVFDDFDTPENFNDDPFDDGVRAQILKVAQKHSELIQLETLGLSHQGREIYALALSNHTIPKEEKGAVLFIGMHHAREWVTVDLMMRLVYWMVENYNSNPELEHLLDQTTVWLVPVMNPDGYQYTFDHNRMWRKNLRDNDGNGKIDRNDGVDLNRNYDYLWGYDEFGASQDKTSGTYRGPSPGSEPETQAIVKLINREPITHAISYHTFGNLILYPNGYQGYGKPADQPMFEYLAGKKETPAIHDSTSGKPYLPTVSSGLYVTNGDFDDWAYNKAGVIPFTVELTNSGTGFVFPDEEEKLETVFQDNLPFVMDLIKSSVNPQSPKSHIQQQSLKTVHHQPIKRSHGKSQEVEIIVPRGHTATLFYQKKLSDSPSEALFRHFDKGIYFDRMISRIRRAQRGDEIKYYINYQNGGSFHRLPEGGYFAYEVEQASQNRILLVSGEGVEADDNQQYLNYYQYALGSSNFAGRYDTIVQLPGEDLPYFDILSHYSHIIWYTGDNKNSISEKQAEHLVNYLRRGGHLFLTGQNVLGSLFESGNSAADNFLLEVGIGHYLPKMAMLGADDNQQLAIESHQDGDLLDDLAITINGEDSAQNQKNVAGLTTKDPDLARRQSKVEALPTFTAKAGKDQYSYLSQSLTVSEDSKELKLNYMFILWGAFYFIEVNDKSSGTWTTVIPIHQQASPWNPSSSAEYCANYLEKYPHLKNYLKETDCSNKDSFKPLFYQNSLSEVKVDLSDYVGKEIELRFSFITLDEASDGTAYFQSIAVGADKFDPSQLLIEGDWLKTAEPVTVSTGISTDQSIFFSFGLEGVSGHETRTEIMERVLDYLAE